MINKQQSLGGKFGASVFFKSVILTGMALIFILKPGFSKTNEEIKAEIQKILKDYPTKEWKIQETNNNDQQTYHFDQGQDLMDGGNDAFSFAMNNIHHYPDMKKHLNDMINQFGTDTERKDVVSKIFNETLMNIPNPKQRTAAIIYALEGFVFRESDFGDNHSDDITRDTFIIMERARVEYETRLKAWLVNIESIHADIKKHTQELERNQQELTKNKQELEKNRQKLEKNRQELDKINQQLIDILNKISSEDMKTNENIRNLVIEAKALCFKYGKEINPHMDELFSWLE